MNTRLLNRLLLLLACGALLLVFATRPQQKSKTATEKDALPLSKQKTLGPQLLWESLSHQFLTSVQQ